jgi:hypothetical protein
VNLGVPNHSVVRYEEALKADKYVLIVHGGPEEVHRAQVIIDQAKATESAVFSRV